MIFWIKTACLFLIRSKRTSLVLTLMVMSAVSCLIFLSSLAMGVNDAMVRNSVGLFSGHISVFDIPGDVAKEDFYVKGVEKVLSRVSEQGFFYFNNKIEMISIIGVEPLQEKQVSAFWKKILKGRFLKDNADEIFISETIARRLNASIGDRLRYSKKPELVPGPETKDFLISGIYKTGIDKLDNGVSFCDIRAIKSNDSRSAALFLKDGVTTEYALDQLVHKKLGKTSYKTWQQQMPDLEQLISLNYFSMSIVIVIVFIIVSLGITSAFSIFILKSIREYGIMKVMGMTARETVSLLLWEVFLINTIASFMGMVVGIIIVLVFQNIGIDLSGYTSHNQYFLVSGVIYPRLTIYSLCLPPLSALIFSFPAAIWPAIMVIRKNAVDILRGN